MLALARLSHRNAAVVAMLLPIPIVAAMAAVAHGQSTMTPEAMFKQIDANGDGQLTMGEATIGNRSFLEKIFKAAEKPTTGSLSNAEFMTAYQRYRGTQSAATNAAPKTAPSADAAKPSDAPPAGLMDLADGNADGKVSRAEWSKVVQSFSRLDANKDNALDSSELEATGGAAELLVKLGDADGDGKITRAEWAKLSQSFAQLDTNKDSSVDEPEFKAAAEALSSRASGSASLAASDGSTSKPTGPVLWRGRIEGRGAIELLVTGNQIVGRDDSRSLGSGTFTMTAGDGKTGNMDAVYTDGPNAGEVCLGIYQLEGDTLRWCVSNRSGQRPNGMATGNGNWLMVLTKVAVQP
ncbi:MAG TPA: hypothetical protein VG713_02450 [Pirellulales bacterium]|nr:hypothetical protein [Pirellulales bacterium]